MDVGDFVGSGQEYQDILAWWPLCSSLSSQERTFFENEGGSGIGSWRRMEKVEMVFKQMERELR